MLKKPNVLVVWLVIVFVITARVESATIWNEAVMGDIGDLPPTDFGFLGTGEWDIFGSLDAGNFQGADDGIDEWDFFTFSTDYFWSFDVVGVAFSGNTRGDLVLLGWVDDSLYVDTDGGVQSVTSPTDDVFLNALPGDVEIRAVPGNNRGIVDYHFRISVSDALPDPEPGPDISPVPIPAAAWLFASALGVFGCLGKQWG